MICWRNGEIVEAASAVSAADRSFLIGEGAFETLLVADGVPAFVTEHLERLKRGTAILGIDTALGEEELVAAARALFERSGKPARAALRITLSGAGTGRGLVRPAKVQPSKLATLAAAPPRPAAMRLHLAASRRWSGSPLTAFKCTGAYAVNALARAEATAAGADEALMLNDHGRLASASAANVFMVADGVVLTPPVEEGAMPGVVRAKIFEAARRTGAEICERAISAAALASAPLFLTNSLIGVAEAHLDENKNSPNKTIAALRRAFEEIEAEDIARRLERAS